MECDPDDPVRPSFSAGRRHILELPDHDEVRNDLDQRVEAEPSERDRVSSDRRGEDEHASDNVPARVAYSRRSPRRRRREWGRSWWYPGRLVGLMGRMRIPSWSSLSCSSSR